MSLLLVVAAVAHLGTLLIALLALRRVSQTSLLSAGYWLLAAVLAWAFALALEVRLVETSTGMRDLSWLMAAALGACAPIGVLGARRPGVGFWSVFVLLPLLLVLLWPALASTRVWRVGNPLELETPALLAFLIVLVMGCGNYFGTRFTLCAMGFGLSIVLTLAPLAATAPDLLKSSGETRAIATLLLAGVAILSHRKREARAASQCLIWDRVWGDFVDHFGLVWAKRVMDRLNESARYENWGCRLHWHGIVWDETSSEGTARSHERLAIVLRWLLKRFVDPEWIEYRLDHRTNTEACVPKTVSDRS